MKKKKGRVRGRERERESTYVFVVGAAVTFFANDRKPLLKHHYANFLYSFIGLAFGFIAIGFN